MKKNRGIVSNRNIVGLVVIVLVVVVTAGYLLYSFTPAVFYTYFLVIGPTRDARLQKRLLCKTNHQALLDECRILSKQVVIDNPDRGKEEPMGVVMMKVPDSDLSRFRLIRNFGCRVFVDICGVVSIQGGGTMRHFGVDAYPKDFTAPSSNFDYGNRELVPGLWYYDDLYNRKENYDKTIGAMLRRRRK